MLVRLPSTELGEVGHRTVGEANRPRLGDAALVRKQGDAVKDVKQERSQSDLHFHRWGQSPGSPGEERPGEGKDGAESPGTRLGTGLAVRWDGGMVG